MIDFGWTELFLIMAVVVLVIGPNELPALMVGLGRLVRRITYIRYAISQQFDEVMREADMQDIGRGVNFEAPAQDHDFDEKAGDDAAYQDDGVDDGEEDALQSTEVQS